MANAQRYGSGLVGVLEVSHGDGRWLHDLLAQHTMTISRITTNFIAAYAVNIWTTGLKRLKIASKACPETLCVPANSPLYRHTTTLHCRYTRAPQHDLSQQTKPISRQSVCSASASHQGCGLWRVWALGISERRCLSAASFDVHPQWPCPTKLPAQRAAVRLAGALRTLWRKVTN